MERWTSFEVLRGSSWIVAIYFSAVLLGGSMLAPPVYWMLQAWGYDGSFHGIANLSFIVAALAGLIPVFRQLQLQSPQCWGFGVPLPKGIRPIATGFGLGLISMGLVVAVEFIIGLQLWDSGHDLGDSLQAALIGCFSGFAIAFVEETYFRGGLQSLMRRYFGVAAAIWATAVLYSVSHLLSNEISGREINWTSGFRIVRDACISLGNPEIHGALLALLLAGILLALLRQSFGHIYFGIGLHAGWVGVIQWAREVSDLNTEHSHAWLVSGAHDNVIGYLAALILAGVVAICWLWLRYGSASGYRGVD